MLHIEFASASRKQAARLKAELKSLLQSYPTHPIVLIHLGQLEPKEAGALIASYPNLFFMTSRADPVDVERSEGRQPWENVFDGGVLKPRWKQLLATRPDRFIFAMDNHVANSHWSDDAYLGRVSLWRQALETLPPGAAHAIAHGNAERLWNLPKQ